MFIQHGHREIVSRSVEGPIVRTTYAEIRRRALKLAQRLEMDGYREGDRIATLDKEVAEVETELHTSSVLFSWNERAVAA